MPRATVKTESYRESLLESLRNPEDAAQYLNACLADEDSRVFLLALRDVADARGGLRALSRDAHLNRESLYRMLSKSGNPSLESLASVLEAFGLRLAVQATAPPGVGSAESRDSLSGCRDREAYATKGTHGADRTQVHQPRRDEGRRVSVLAEPAPA
jgi:probable addiction module antidote protein